MDAKDLAYTNRVWSGKRMTVPREQLIRLDMGPDAQSALMRRYEALHFHGPYWSSKGSAWFVEVSYPVGDGSVNILSHYSGNLEDFLDVEGIVEQFHQRGYPQEEVRECLQKLNALWHGAEHRT